jgi:Na+/H+ antiporter NhaD/arsenite permease-like protein
MFLGLLPAPYVTWTIAASTIAAMVVRPRRIPEVIWACLGAGLLLAFHLVPFPDALGAVTKGYDVYLFLTGMMVLAELARREDVFDWLAGIAMRAAAGSRARLFALIYLLGIVVTTVLSNDATAVVLTPAVYAVMKRRRATLCRTCSLALSSQTPRASSYLSPIRLISSCLVIIFRRCCRGCEYFFSRPVLQFSRLT